MLENTQQPGRRFGLALERRPAFERRQEGFLNKFLGERGIAGTLESPAIKQIAVRIDPPGGIGESLIGLTGSLGFQISPHNNWAGPISSLLMYASSSSTGIAARRASHIIPRLNSAITTTS